MKYEKNALRYIENNWKYSDGNKYLRVSKNK